MTKSEIEKEFSKGDLRGKGGVDNVLKEYSKDKKVRKDIFDLIFSENRIIAMRAIDAYEKISKNSNVTEEEQSQLLSILGTPKHKEFMWHYVQILGYMEIPNGIKDQVYNYLKEAINDYLDSNIVRVFAMQTMYNLFITNEKYRKEIRGVLGDMAKSSIPSLQSRAMKLLKLYNKV
ncbi:MAG: hypothetical protein UT34_C0001G0525 [candidate division WS6 bacterium GW2011_GWF2_39_15]|uniref:HEAT repeat domain-containing protein n=1 Tax=candidate division WS6 bacterium GW2011_GWF2_39_15 TaxID=1619100 RepID=A0A0G0MR19_9BACT|nr:MAG: hypothetical protein UT34_C0001G0525 [candidate division WS6 bacterium GW2011_GWF2_39_15]